MKNPVFHSKTKHIGVQYHYTKELVGKGDVSFVFCRTPFMVAESLTKAVSREKVEFCMISGADLPGFARGAEVP